MTGMQYDLLKFNAADQVYHPYIEWLLDQEISARDLVYHFPAFVGSVNMARLFALEEVFRRTLTLSGDIADVGTYKGGSFFAFAKLVQIFEPHSNTKVHGFDWFRGQQVGQSDHSGNEGRYVASKEQLTELVNRQGMSGIMSLHDFDLTQDTDSFFENHPWLRFKLIFVDCGIQAVLKSTLRPFWNRLVPGGILLLDHFNHETSPSESKELEEVAGGSEILQFPFSRTPTAWVVKR